MKVLREARKALMYTHVLVYYLEENNRTNILVHNQMDLQNATEKLSGILEKELGIQDLAEIGCKVMDKANYCKSRMHVLLDQVHEGYDNNMWTFMDP